MNNWKVIFATVVIFGAGVLTGGLLVNYVQHPHKKSPRTKATVSAEVRAQNVNQSAHSADNVKRRPPEILSKQFLQKLDVCLQLSAEQREEAQKIISDGQNQIRKAIQDARLEIREILTSEQRVKFDSVIKKPFRKPIFNTNAPPGLPPDSDSEVKTSSAGI